MKKGQTASGSHFREVWAVVFILIAIFALVCVARPHTMGWVGHWVIEVGLRHFFGRMVWAVPLFLILPGLSLIFTSIKVRTSLLNALGAFLCVVVGFELFVRGDVQPWLWPMKLDGGGWVGMMMSTLLQKLFGYNGTWIFLVGVVWVTCMVLFGVTVSGILGFIGRLFDQADVPEEDLPTRAELRTKKSGIKVDPEVKKWVMEQAAPVLETETEPVEPIVSIEPEHPTKPVRIVQEAKFSEFGAEYGVFELPPLELLEPPKPLMAQDSKALRVKRQENAKILEEALASFGVRAKVVHITPGPSVTRYELQPGEGVKISKITSLNKDIALKLAVVDVRIEAPIPGKALVGIEVPNTDIETIVMRHLVDGGDFFSHPSKLIAAMGLTITGESVFMDLAKMPHVLIAGATGSGKSVCVNAIILSILMRATPDEVKFLMIDPKKVELSLYEGIPHLLAPVVTNPNKAAATLKQWALLEMERRYEVFSHVGVKDILGYNQWIEKNPGQKKLPYIVVIIDELADLMMVAAQDVESTICRLAQMSRATGIHLVIATQRPSVNVITGLIKANVPSRISFFLQSQIDSRTILDMPGAEKLLGKGDMLYSPVGSFKPKRLQGIFVGEKEIKQVVNFLKAQGSPEYLAEIIDVTPIEAEAKKGGHVSAHDDQDELFEEAKMIAQSQETPSISYLQRKLRVGYNRAARLMEELEKQGLIIRQDK